MTAGREDEVDPYTAPREEMPGTILAMLLMGAIQNGLSLFLFKALWWSRQPFSVFIFWAPLTLLLTLMLEDRVARRGRAHGFAFAAMLGLVGVAMVEWLTRTRSREDRGFDVLFAKPVMPLNHISVSVHVRFFAAARDAAGVAEASVDLTPGATVADALAALSATYPALASLLHRSRAAVNQSYVGTDHVLGDGDELAVIPPVSGG